MKSGRTPRSGAHDVSLAVDGISTPAWDLGGRNKDLGDLGLRFTYFTAEARPKETARATS